MTLEEIRGRLQSGVPGCQVELVVNGSPSGQNSLLIDREHGLAAATLLCDQIQLDFCSNVTAVDWPDREKTDKVKTKQMVDGVEKEIEQTIKTRIPGLSGSGLSPVFDDQTSGPGGDTDAHRQPQR